MDAPDSDRSLGHSAEQMRALLGDEYPRFERYMTLKTTAVDDNGRVFYDSDVQMYLSMRERDMR